MDLHDRHGKGDAAHEAEVSEKRAPVADHDSVAQMVADCRGDTAAFVKLIKKLAPGQLAEVIAAAQRLYGNAFVHEALALADPNSAHGKQPGVTAGHAGSPNRSGVHGLEHGSPDLFSEQQDAKDAKTAENPRIFGGALQGRYGDTFGAGRMSGQDTQHMGGKYNKWGGNGMPGMNDHKGDAGMFQNTQIMGGSTDVTSTPTPGAPVPIPYPNMADGQGTGKATTSVPLSNGDQVGVAGGVASSTTMGSSRSSAGGITAILGGAPTTTMVGGSAPGTIITPSSPRFLANAGTPRDDQETGGGGVPVVLNRGDAGQVAGGLHRELAGQIGHAGGKGDGTGDVGNLAGSNAGGGMVVNQREKVGGRELAHETGGDIDLDAALKINALVNPTRG